MRPTSRSSFVFKQFALRQDRCAMKVGTDGILLGAWADVQGINQALDIGAGTGLVALMVAQRAPCAEVMALEIEAEAAAQALENAEASPFRERIRICPKALQDWRPHADLDLIITNPPFFSAGIPPHNARKQQARHESSLKLGEILEFAAEHLQNLGRLAIVLPHRRREELIEQGRRHGLHVSRICEVYSRPGKPAHRILAELGFQPQTPKEESLLLREENGDFSLAYQNLTRDFHPFL